MNEDVAVVDLFCGFVVRHATEPLRRERRSLLTVESLGQHVVFN